MTYKTSLKKHFITWQKAVDVRTMRERSRDAVDSRTSGP